MRQTLLTSFCLMALSAGCAPAPSRSEPLDAGATPADANRAPDALFDQGVADAALVAITPAGALVPPRYVSPLSAWSPVTNVCLDAPTSPAPLVASRLTILAARAGLPLVDSGASCQWHLQVADLLPALAAAQSAVWQSAGTQVERHLIVTTVTGGVATTLLYGVDPRGARYAVDAAFALVGKDQSGARYVPAATVIDWPAMAVRGVVEGFYGSPFSFDDRALLLSVMDDTRQNRYVYSPQNDDYAHASWADPYPADQITNFAGAALQAATEGIDLVWAIRPGQGLYYGPTVPISYSSDADFATLTAKYQQLATAGITRFGLFFDDNTEVLTSTADQMMFATFMDAQAYLINRVDDWLRGQDPTARLLVEGTRYTEALTGWQGYNEFMAANVHATVDFLWTGNETYSPTISASDLQAVDTSLGRQPIIWDNWPQDVTALNGRSGDLSTTVQGLLSNPVICSWSHTPASGFVPILGTAGMYEWRPDRYDVNTALTAWAAFSANLMWPAPPSSTPSPSPSPSP